MIFLDSILLLTFVGINIMFKDWLGWDRIGMFSEKDLPITFLTTATLCFLLTDVFFYFSKKPILETVKNILFCVVIVFLVGYPLFTNISLRATSVNYLLIHDGALQTEIASRFLFKGKNPYAVTYFKTPLQSWPYSEKNDPQAVNPALYHYTYLPFFLVSSALGQAVQKIILHWEDIRFTLLAQYLTLIGLVWIVASKLKNKYLFFLLFAASPVVTHFLLEGRNDTVSFFYLFATAFFLTRKKIILSAIFLGCAIAFKQTLWLTVPFFFGYIWFENNLKKQAKTYILVSLATALFFIVPFFIWNPKAFLDSTLGYLSGSTLHSYPINTIGFGQILLSTGVIRNVHSYFPFWILQLVTTIPLLYFFLKKLKKNPKLSSVFLFFSITTLVFLYFSRIFSDSYLTLVYLSLVAAFLFHEKERL